MVKREWDPSSCSSHVRIRLLPDAFRKMDRLRKCAIDLAELVAEEHMISNEGLAALKARERRRARRKF